MLRVFGAPSRYVQGPGALDTLGQELLRLAPDAVLLVDPLVEDMVGERLRTACASSGLDARFLTFGGECSAAEVDRLVAQLGGRQPSVVAAAGGGKCLDTGKGLAHRCGAKVASVPTVASTDAPTSHNYVFYDEHHRLASVEKLPGNPVLVVVDTQVIARAPRYLFVAGIGDAMAKLFEVDRCIAANGPNIFGARACETARVLGRGCYETVLRDGEAALEAVARGEPDEALERVVEATVLMSGLSFESGGLSIAHSMTRGLSAVAALTHALHGRQVAYALLVQLELEGQPQTVSGLKDFYRRVGLPCTLQDLAEPQTLGYRPTAEEIGVIARLSLAAPHASHFPYRVTEAQMAAVIVGLEGARDEDAAAALGAVV